MKASFKYKEEIQFDLTTTSQANVPYSMRSLIAAEEQEEKEKQPQRVEEEITNNHRFKHHAYGR